MQLIRDIKAIPVLRPAIALAIGIIANKWLALSEYYLLFGIIPAISYPLAVMIFRLAIKPNYSWIIGAMILLIFFCFGAILMKVFDANHKHIPEPSNNYWIGEVLSSPVVKNKLARFDLNLLDDSVLQTNYKTQILLQVGTNAILPQPGQIICVRTIPERIKGPDNPGEFDYAAYLYDRGFLYRCFIKEGEWSYICTPRKFSLSLISLKLRNRLWSKIESYYPQNQNLGVLYALGLGSKELLTPEIREAYAATGAMHVLALSGLHVGLIWMVLGYIFFWFKKLPGGKIFQFFVIAGLIWFYAIMTGGTPSVVRSAGMFTLVSLGGIIRKETSTYNSLAVSAFTGLLFNPQWLTDAGFQLSYIAVISIVFFQPRISSLLSPKYYLTKKIWDICSVSIAAQIGTLPLTLFYFNRFPPWFIISNLVVIPLVTIIMVIFIILLLFILIPPIFSLVLKVLLFTVGLMNMGVSYIEGLPGPAMDRIYLNNFQMFCLVMLLLGIAYFIRYRNNFLFFSGLISLVFLTFTGTANKYLSSRQAELILFSVPGKMILGIADGTKGVFMHNSPDSVDIEQLFNFKCKPYLIQNRISEVDMLRLGDSLNNLVGMQKIPGKSNYFFRSGDKSVIILNDPLFFRGIRAGKCLHSDILILNDKIPTLWKGQGPLFITEQLVISSSVSRYLYFDTSKNYIIQTDSVIDTRISGAYRCLLPFIE